jgi:hypothetical protein
VCSPPDAEVRTVALDKSRARLEQLEGAAGGTSGASGEATVNLTALEYTNHMKKLQDDLYFAWSKQERVKSLKLAIQSAKLLGHTAVPTMYPAMFCFMVGVLETFGQLVFERIRVKSEEIDAKLGGGKPLMGACVLACFPSVWSSPLVGTHRRGCRGFHVSRHRGRSQGNVPQLDLQGCVHP